MDKEIVLRGNADTALQVLDELFTALTPFMKILQKWKKDQLKAKLSLELLLSNESLAQSATVGPEI